jgi:transposase
VVDGSVPDLTPPHVPELLERIAGLEKENALLRQKIDLLVRKLFGSKSEQLDSAQLLLLLQGMDEPPGKAPEPVAAEAPPRRRRGIGRLVGGRAALDGSIASA